MGTKESSEKDRRQIAVKMIAITSVEVKREKFIETRQNVKNN